ncbi:DUF1289 domain-containing protein [Halopseudomonas salina]|uniref:DUF1289 domain-containing protein n=1 Tax=Halopseudomonas salina TaxID=1323744 RepID=A0ABQ1NWS5_9GAMM|nr:DUF1289 domain-containing protein [Halopseudomonas salina]
MSGVVASPCIGVCALDERDICTGCQRSAVEITQWFRMNEEQRREVLARCEERARAQGLWFSINKDKGFQA